MLSSRRRRRQCGVEKINVADGHQVPVTAAVIGTVILPAVVAVGAIAGLSKDWTLEIYRKDAEASD